MCFKGTEKRPNALAITKELDSIGAQYNAFTSHEYTGYYAKAHPKYLSKIIDVVSDIYINPNFDSKEIEKEKGVIIEEMNMYQDTPARYIGDLFMELLYGDQPAGWGIIGNKETVRSFGPEDFIKYQKNHYVASATTVILAGAFDKKDAIKEVEKAFSKISTSKKFNKISVKEMQKKPEILFKHKDTDQTHLMLGVRAFKASDKRIPILTVMNSVLSGGMSSRLFQKLREEMGVCYYVRSFVDEYTDHGYFAVGAGVDNQRMEEVIKAILEELKRLKTEKISEQELKKTKDYLVGNLFLNLETTDSLAELYGFQNVLGLNLKNPKEITQQIREVSAEQIQKVAKEIFDKKNLNLAVIGKQQNKQSGLQEILEKGL